MQFARWRGLRLVQKTLIKTRLSLQRVGDLLATTSVPKWFASLAPPGWRAVIQGRTLAGLQAIRHRRRIVWVVRARRVVGRVTTHRIKGRTFGAELPPIIYPRCAHSCGGST